MARTSLARKTSRRKLPPGRLRGQRPQPSGAKTFFQLISAVLLGAIALTCSMGALVGGGAYSAYAGIAESLEGRLDAIDGRQVFQTSRIYDRNGILLYEFFDTGRRTKVAIADVDEDLINATVAIEDKTFFENPGVDYEGIAKALVRSLQAGEETGGASTITQQLIKNVVLTDEERVYENRYRRKLTEIILAQELDEKYTKEQVLELYLNEIFYGNMAYGIQAAAETFFDTDASNLSLAQASLLAGLPQLPTVYNPIEYLEDGQLPGARVGPNWLTDADDLPRELPPPKARQVGVLRQMVDEGYATKEEATRALREPLQFAPQEVPLNAPHFVFYVRDLLESNERYRELLKTGGLSIVTSLDLRMNQMVQQKAAERIAELEERNIHNAAVVVMQPRTGQILSMVGSIDYNRTVPTKTPGKEGNVMDGQVNVTVRERQPGSALKPFTYLSAMEQGDTPATVYWDVPTEFLASATSDFSQNAYAPLNYNGKFNGPVRMRTALANSLNIPAVLALKKAGVQPTIDLLRRVGIGGLQRGADFYGLSLTLGGGEVTPLDLTTAYNTLASGGYYLPPTPILSITAPDGTLGGELDGQPDVLEDHSQPPDLSQMQPAVDSRLAAIITDMLSEDRARQAIWGLNSPLKLSRPAAVKTGTTNDWRDAWAVGYAPYVTVGVWTGNNNNEETAQVESLAGGGIIWRNVMEELFANPEFAAVLAEPYPDGQLPLEFPQVAGVERKPICSLPGPYGGYSEELFTAEMQVERCDVFRKVQVVSVSGAGGEQEVAEGEAPAGRYCLPQEGVNYPPELLSEITVYNFPKTDPDLRANYRGWGRGGIEDIPACTPELVAVTKPTPSAPVAGAIRMPDLERYGENQAKDILAALGIPASQIYVDYQTRQRIPDVFDQYAPYAIVSTLPRSGDWILPGTTVVLGVRSPDEGNQPTAQPAQPTAQPTQPAQPTQALPAPAQPTEAPPQPEQPAPQPTQVVPQLPITTPVPQPSAPPPPEQGPTPLPIP
jgi:membrane peptidoglycan carboxypeptidase